MTHLTRPRFLTDYAEQADEAADELVVPEDLSTLDDEALDALHAQAVDAFNDLYGEDGSGLSDEDLTTLEELAQSVEALRTEQEARAERDGERAEQAAELAARVRPATEEEPEAEQAADDAPEGEGDGEDFAAETEDETEPEQSEEAVTAAARRPLSVNLSRVRSRRSAAPAPAEEGGLRSVAFAAPNVPGFIAGQGMDRMDLASAVDKRLSSVNSKAYASAASAGKRISERFPVATVTRTFPEEMRAEGANAEDAISAAVSENRLPGNSLTAAGGWCAPSEILYDLCDVSEARNLISLPEIQVNRGGIQYPTAPDYAAIYGDTGFCFTEQDDIDGNYDGENGPKPCFHVPCPEFQEERLEVCGVCVTAGLLQQRGYPEAIANYIDLTWNAHFHRLSAATINRLVEESTAVTMPSGQAGATAPLLTSIELQAQHYRATNRMSDTATLELVFPMWVRGVVRSDLSRRLGVDLISVTDARINGFFSNLNVNPQWVVDWQDIATTDAAEFTSWPGEVQFLLYAAGTFVRGVSPSITFENLYDSVGLGTNDYTALFTEDPYLVAKRCNDSRVVTVDLCANGSTHAGEAIGCDGTGGGEG